MSKSDEAFAEYICDRYCGCQDSPNDDPACTCGVACGHCVVHCGLSGDCLPNTPLERSSWDACCRWHQRELERMAAEHYTRAEQASKAKVQRLSLFWVQHALCIEHAAKKLR